MKDTLQLLTFDNLAQRVLYRYVFGFADFEAVASHTVTVEAQRAFYEICGALVRGIADDPALLGLPVDHPDEWLGPNEALNRRPEFAKVRGACQKAAGALFGLLFTAGLRGEEGGGKLTLARSDAPKMTGKALQIGAGCLARFGIVLEAGKDHLAFSIPERPEALGAWQLLARTCAPHEDGATRFALWTHGDDAPWFLRRVAALLGLEEGFLTRSRKSIGRRAMPRDTGAMPTATPTPWPRMWAA